MNIVSPLPEIVPAAEKARRMGETVDRLEACVPAVVKYVPGLLRLLMQFFALLRGAIGRLAEQVETPEIEVSESQAIVTAVVTRDVAAVAGRVPVVARVVARARRRRAPVVVAVVAEIMPLVATAIVPSGASAILSKRIWTRCNLKNFQKSSSSSRHNCALFITIS